MGEKKPSEGRAPISIRCFKCGVLEHRATDYRSSVYKCFKSGKIGHKAADCKGNIMTCYNRGEQGHISTTFQKPKKDQTRGDFLPCREQRIPVMKD